jgi:hypothetical protein
VFVHQEPAARDGKFSAKAIRGRYVGQSSLSPAAVRVFLTDPHPRVIESGNVTFHELGQAVIDTADSDDEELVPAVPSTTTGENILTERVPDMPASPLRAAPDTANVAPPPAAGQAEPALPQVPVSDDTATSSGGETGVQTQQAARYPSRNRSNTHHRDYVNLDDFEEEEDTSASMAFVRAFAFSAQLTTTATQTSPPTTYANALARADAKLWQEAMDEEWMSLTSLDAYQFVPTASLGSASVIPGRWVYTYKFNSNGSINKYKARYVVQGFMQRRDGMDVYSPVPSMTLTRTALAVAAQRHMVIEQLDVKTAFLQARVPDGENIYVRAPLGFGKEGSVLRLKSFLYGLRRSPKEWNRTLTEFLREQCGLHQTPVDPCIYTSASADLILITYVDDIIIIGATQEIVDKSRQQLDQRFSVRLLGPISWFLGISINYDRTAGRIQLSQKRFVNDLLKSAGMATCNSAMTPTIGDFTLRLEEQGLSALDDAMHDKYRSMVGSLMYLSTITRPDISFAVSQLARYMAPGKATQQHWDCVHHLFRYLRSSADYSITYNSVKAPVLEGYVDASWGSCTLTRRSVAGFVFTLCNGPIMWRSFMEKSVALSSSGAEYMALSDASREVVVLRSFLFSLSAPQDMSTILYEDNTAAIAIAEGEGQPQRTRHIDIRFHYVKELVARGVIEIVYIPTAQQPADGLTKGLDKIKHGKFVAQLFRR